MWCMLDVTENHLWDQILKSKCKYLKIVVGAVGNMFSPHLGDNYFYRKFNKDP